MWGLLIAGSPYVLISTPPIKAKPRMTKRWRASLVALLLSSMPPINGVTYFEVLDVALSDGFNYLDVNHATGTAVYIGGGLRVGRTPPMMAVRSACLKVVETMRRRNEDQNAKPDTT